jgi:hypothetical protein
MVPIISARVCILTCSLVVKVEKECCCLYFMVRIQIMLGTKRNTYVLHSPQERILILEGNRLLVQIAPYNHVLSEMWEWKYYVSSMTLLQCKYNNSIHIRQKMEHNCGGMCSLRRWLPDDDILPIYK